MSKWYEIQACVILCRTRINNLGREMRETTDPVRRGEIVEMQAEEHNLLRELKKQQGFIGGSVMTAPQHKSIV